MAIRRSRSRSTTRISRISRTGGGVFGSFGWSRKEKHVALLDAVLQTKKFPKTFIIPAPKFTKALIKGVLAKVVCDGERFWAKITDVIGAGEYVGRVSNKLVFSRKHGLKYNDLFAFTWRNVIDIHA